MNLFVGENKIFIFSTMKFAFYINIINKAAVDFSWTFLSFYFKGPTALKN